MKFPRAEVVFVGDRHAATEYLRANGGEGRLIVGSTITGGDGSTITGGDGSTITASWWDHKSNRRRCVIGYVGEDGILPGVAYRVTKTGDLIQVESPEQA